MKMCLCSVYRYVFSVGNLFLHMGCIYGGRPGASVAQILSFGDGWRCHLGDRYFPLEAKRKLWMFFMWLSADLSPASDRSCSRWI